MLHCVIPPRKTQHAAQDIGAAQGTTAGAAVGAETVEAAAIKQ